MSKEKIYITTVKIAVTASSEDEAFELISISLSDNLKEHGAILDWRYDQPDNAFAERGEYKEEEYEEGLAFVDNYMQRVVEALKEGRKLLAIKILKDATGVGLREAKETVDQLCPEYLKKDEPKDFLQEHKDQNKVERLLTPMPKDFLQEHKDQNSKPDFIHFKR
jgi:ribosomal protein L7/L12